MSEEDTTQDGVATVVYYKLPDGSFGRQTSSTGPVELPDGAVIITEAEYLELLAAFEAERARRAAETAAAELAQAKADYDVLIALGVPDATARRMSGYNPPAPTPEGP